MGHLGLQPSEFWAMRPQEFWLLYETKRPRMPGEYRGTLSEDDCAEMYEDLMTKRKE